MRGKLVLLLVFPHSKDTNTNEPLFLYHKRKKSDYFDFFLVLIILVFICFDAQSGNNFSQYGSFIKLHVVLNNTSMQKKNTLIFTFRRIRSLHFLLKDGEDAAYEEGNGWQGVYLPPELSFLL